MERENILLVEDYSKDKYDGVFFLEINLHGMDDGHLIEKFRDSKLYIDYLISCNFSDIREFHHEMYMGIPINLFIEWLAMYVKENDSLIPCFYVLNEVAKLRGKDFRISTLVGINNSTYLSVTEEHKLTKAIGIED